MAIAGEKAFIVRDHRHLEKEAWWRPAFLPAAALYSLAIAARAAWYRLGMRRPIRAGVPVLSVGNITAGGTGKTPMVEWVARFLLSLHRKPAILSRGYGAASDEHGPGRNDEALLLAQNLPEVPHLANPDRSRSARLAVERYNADCLIMDDGFQHWRLARDLDLVLIDALDPFGGGMLLPVGRLREPVTSLRRAQAIVVTRSDMISEEKLESLCRELSHLAPDALIAWGAHQPVSMKSVSGEEELPTEFLRGKKVFAFCGIGNPLGFEMTLARCGASLAHAWRFRDHHHYTAEELHLISREARDSGAELIMTTQKDAVKIRQLPKDGPPFFALRVAMEVVAGRAELEAAIRRALANGS